MPTLLQAKTISNRPNRSLLTPILAVSGWTTAVLLACLTLFGCALSLWISYKDLSRRGEWAAHHIERLIAGGVITANVGGTIMQPEQLVVDPEMLAVTVVDASGNLLAAHQIGSESIVQAAAARIASAPLATWTLKFAVTSHAILGRGRAARVTIAYNTAPAWRRARFHLIDYGGGAILILIAALLVQRRMFRRLMRPMRDLADVTSQLAREDYRSEVWGRDREDEVGTVARAIDAFKTQLLDRQALRAVADLRTSQAADRHKQIDARVDVFRDAIGCSLEAVASLSDQMQVAATALASIATQTTTRAGNAVLAIGRTSGNVSEVANAAEDLSFSIRDIERQVEQTRGIVAAATQSTAETSGVIKGLFTRAEEIDEVIGLIQNIAAQTNMLALNATIEAARAGQAGRGFAVVAQEVKSLADQTAKASHRVADHVRAIQETTSQAVEAIGSIDSTMLQAEQYSETIAIAVKRQSQASTAISRNAAEAAKAAGEAATNMKRLAAGIGETDQSAAQVHHSATDVGSQASDLAKTIDAFLTDTALLRDDQRQVRSAG